MPTSASVEADPAAGPGHAVIRISGGAVGLADPRFAITRKDFEDGVLGPTGWQVAEALLTPINARRSGGDLVLAIGPSVVNRLESGIVMLSVPAAGFDGGVYWPDLPLAPELGDGHGIIAAAPVAIEPKTAPLMPPVIRAQTSPAASQASSPARRSFLPFLILGLVVIGAGAWWALNRHPAAALPRTASTAPPATAAPSGIQQAPRAADCTTKSTVKDIVACTATPDALFAVARQRWDQKHPDQGFLLMQIAADRGSGPAALRLAQLYDPDSFRPGGPIPEADARQAAKYYRMAVQHGQQAAIAPRAALHQRLQQDSDGGDPLAGLSLKDFWP